MIVEPLMSRAFGFINMIVETPMSHALGSIQQAHHTYRPTHSIFYEVFFVSPTRTLGSLQQYIHSLPKTLFYNVLHGRLHCSQSRV